MRETFIVSHSQYSFRVRPDSGILSLPALPRPVTTSALPPRASSSSVPLPGMSASFLGSVLKEEPSESEASASQPPLVTDAYMTKEELGEEGSVAAVAATAGAGSAAPPGGPPAGSEPSSSAAPFVPPAPPLSSASAPDMVTWNLMCLFII